MLRRDDVPLAATCIGLYAHSRSRLINQAMPFLPGPNLVWITTARKVECGAFTTITMSLIAMV
jgi:hypothetical protein